MLRTFSGRRCDTGSVSGSASAATNSSAPAITTSTANTQCQDAFNSTAAPSDGASTGATPSTSINRDMTVAAADSANRSPTTAIATTIAAAAPMPCRPRATPSSAMFGANRHSTDATMCSTMPAISGLRRPSESDSGPTISWPSARPGQRPGERELRDRRRHPEVVGDLRQCGQIHVDGERAQRDHDAEDDDHPGAARRRDSLSGVSDLRASRSTTGDVAMKMVSAASQYFLPGFSDSDRDHVRARAGQSSFVQRASLRGQPFAQGGRT